MGKIRYIILESYDPNLLVKQFLVECEYLLRIPETEIETSLLIHPHLFPDFLEFNDFLQELDDLLEEAQLIGHFQVASFHPDYQFADTKKEDPANKTNQSPFPMLHLLREDHVQKAIQAYGDTDGIWKHNVELMRKISVESWS